MRSSNIQCWSAGITAGLSWQHILKLKSLLGWTEGLVDAASEKPREEGEGLDMKREEEVAQLTAIAIALLQQ